MTALLSTIAMMKYALDLISEEKSIDHAAEDGDCRGL